MADISVASVSEEDRDTFVKLICEENHYDSREDDKETQGEFADRVYQENLDKKLIDVEGEEWKHGLSMAMALAEEEYVKDNPPPVGFHVDPPNAALLAEAKEK